MNINDAIVAFHKTQTKGSPFSNTNTSTTTVIKNSPGVLKRVVINTKGTVASTVTIYNNTAGSGSIIGIIDSLNLSGSFEYNATATIGITIVTTGTVAPNVTVIYE